MADGGDRRCQLSGRGRLFPALRRHRPSDRRGSFVDAAREEGLAVRYVVQTHTHEDFVSGARALAARVPGAGICLSGHGAPAYRFAHRALKDEDELELGSVRLKVLHTPGHTPEHISLQVSKTGDNLPFAVLSGGALLVGTAGRTDLTWPAG